MRPAILLFCCCFFAFGQSTSPTQAPANSSDQKPLANVTAPTSDLVNQFDGTWEGELTFLQGATLHQKEPETLRYRLTIQGPIVHVYVVRPERVKEIKPGKFHIDLLMTNAIIYAMDSGKDDEGTWVETWVFTLTQFDRDTLLTNFSRVVNNLDLPLTSDHSKFAKEAAGKLSRTAFGQDTSIAPETKPQTPASSADQSAEDQPKKYDLKLTWKNAVQGHKSELSEDDSQAMMMKMLKSDGTILMQQDNRSRSFAAVEVISKVADGRKAVSRWTFSKATQHRNDQDVPFAFQGRTVVVSKEPASKNHFAFDDGNPVSTEDATVLAGLWDGGTEPRELSGEEIFAPKSPVAVGEQWMPDIAMIAQGLKLGDDIDLKRSTVKATLKSTEIRDGVEFGHIKLLMELWLTKFGPMQFDNPILIKADGDIDACIDGAQPDGTVTLTMNAKGNSTARVDSPPREVHFSFDLEVKLQQRQKTIG